MSDFPITIFHNPACGASRNTLPGPPGRRAAGYEPEAIEYVEPGWTRPQLEALLTALAASPRKIMREKGPPAAELGLTDTRMSYNPIINTMVQHPSRPAGQEAGELHGSRMVRSCGSSRNDQKRT